MNTQLDQLKSKIAEIIPEIMELKFGCSVNPTNDSVHMVLTVLIGGYVKAIEIIDDEGTLVFGLPQRIFPKEILGREITLADVIKSLNCSKYEDEISFRFGAVQGESLIISCHDDDVDDPNGFGIWDLSKPLSGQSPETLSFLHSLLCKGE